MLASMTALQFSEWIAYYSLEPFGEERADWRQAFTSCILANAHRGKNSKASELDDFMLKVEDDEPREQTEQQQQNVFELMNKAVEARKRNTL